MVEIIICPFCGALKCKTRRKLDTMRCNKSSGVDNILSGTLIRP